MAAVRPAAALCDLVTAARIAGEPLHLEFGNWEEFSRKVAGTLDHSAARSKIEGLDAFHFPIAFPEVFLRDRPGFDVIVGNPPWEKARVEELEFWGRHAPGIRGLGTADRNTALRDLRRTRPDLVALWEAERATTERLRDAVRHFPGMNTGHPDLFRAFAVRSLALGSPEGGRVGVVLPGDAFKIKGGGGVRRLMQSLCSDVDVQLLTNKGEWVFDDVHEQKLIALVTARIGDANAHTVYSVPPECHYLEVWEKRSRDEAFVVRDSWLAEYGPALVIPTLPSVASGQIPSFDRRESERGQAATSPPPRSIIFAILSFISWVRKPGRGLDRQSWPVLRGRVSWGRSPGTYKPPCCWKNSGNVPFRRRHEGLERLSHPGKSTWCRSGSPKWSATNASGHWDGGTASISVNVVFPMRHLFGEVVVATGWIPRRLRTLRSHPPEPEHGREDLRSTGPCTLFRTSSHRRRAGLRRAERTSALPPVLFDLPPDPGVTDSRGSGTLDPFEWRLAG